MQPDTRVCRCFASFHLALPKSLQYGLSRGNGAISSAYDSCQKRETHLGGESEKCIFRLVRSSVCSDSVKRRTNLTGVPWREWYDRDRDVGVFLEDLAWGAIIPDRRKKKKRNGGPRVLAISTRGVFPCARMRPQIARRPLFAAPFFANVRVSTMCRQHSDVVS
jgi:hypothetical protein